MSLLSTQVGSLQFKNPILAASGTFGYGLEFAKLIDLESIGGFVTKGLSMHPRGGNASPRIQETSCGMLNSIGLHNVGVEVFIENKLPLLREFDTRVIVNIYGETPEEFVQVAKVLNKAEGVDALEINVSCPNVKKGGLDLGTNPNEVEALVAEIRRETTKPLWAKLTPNVTDIKSIAKAAIDGGIDALSLINSVKATAINWKTAKPHLSSVYGGLSGPAIKPIALARVLEVASHFEIPIVGVGGISKGEDVLEFLVGGASAVQVGTQNFVRTHATQIILQEMKELLETENETVSSIQGTFHQKTKEL